MKRTQPTHSYVYDAKLWHEKNYWNVDPSKPHIFLHSYPVLLYYTLRQALSHLGKQGLVNSWKKHHQVQKYLEDKLFQKFTNLGHFVENPSNRLIGALVLTPPPNIKPILIHEYMLEK
jgi:aspartate aminotransferase-like enzyme